MYRGERFNSYSHLLGTLLAVVGFVVLITDLYGNARQVVSVSVYGATLVLLYGASTLYHSISHPSAKKVLQKFDHCAIYLLIAGSYTPFSLVTLHGPWGWTLFGISWGLALIGIIQELLIGKRTRVFSLIIYVLMGWLILIAIKPLHMALPAGGMAWLVAGGVIYSVGIVFFVLDEKIRHGHGIWHLFVLAGSICHFVSIVFYVV